MSIYFVREEGIPLEQRRGLETIDRNLLFVLVRASVEQVAQVFSTLRQMDVWIRNAYESEVKIHNIVEVEDLKIGQRTTLRFEGLLPNEIERMDYLAQQ